MSFVDKEVRGILLGKEVIVSEETIAATSG